MTATVLEFSSANLLASLSNCWCPPDDAARSDQVQYLYGYLHDMGAQTIVVENPYIDGDYLEDFASYYVRCFRAYEKECKRLHFFSEKIPDKEFQAFILGRIGKRKLQLIKRSYLGFCVARPLPVALVGRTILATYPSTAPDGRTRHYTVVRDYDVHLFGRDLSVRGLPFQEQDTVLAACATVALWCAFHKTSELFAVQAPRPASITQMANRAGHRGRPVPSHGLRIEEMCYAIRSVSLEPELFELGKDHLPWVSLAYAHLKWGLPVILVVEIEGALHAITLTGYSLSKARVHDYENAGPERAVPMTGLRVSEFYGHDDQIGPHAHQIIKSPTGLPESLTGSWKDGTTYKDLKPQGVLIPVYNKVRVTFLEALDWIGLLHSALGYLVPNDHTAFEWDVYLTTTNDYKSGLHQQDVLDLKKVQALLLETQPRFLWRADLRVEGRGVLHILIDATDIARSFPLRTLVCEDEDFREDAFAFLTRPDLQQQLEDGLGKQLLSFLKTGLSAA
jgi:hypothetical protein